MGQLFPKFDILNIILLVSQHEITKSIHFYMYMVTFRTDFFAIKKGN